MEEYNLYTMYSAEWNPIYPPDSRGRLYIDML